MVNENAMPLPELAALGPAYTYSVAVVEDFAVANLSLERPRRRP